MKIIAFTVLFYSILNAQGLYRSSDMVIDSTNKLMWEDSVQNTKIRLSQADALEYCQKSTFGGYSNWRLPTVKEYQLIIDKTRRDEIMINPTFKYILQTGYWTSDKTWRTLNLYGYYIYFKSGTAYYENKTYKKFVRCVRDM
ncbi:MAG: DUF1566 domain-containing protein [Campylobacterales bacterium]|nr:DUF1566 domain-containing protein [Campylobacterales bacterium]